MTRWARFMAWLLAVGPVLLTACDEVELNVGNPTPQRTVRSAPEPIRTRTAASRPGAASAPAADPGLEPSYYQVVLTSDPVPVDAPPGIRYLHLKCAPPRGIGEAMSMLYLPSGGTGSSARYTLIYALASEWSAAAGHVETLDVPASDGAAGAGMGCAVSTLYTLLAEPAERPRVRALVDQFDRVASESQARWEKWAARMLAGGLVAQRMSDFEQAARLYAAAGDAATPGSIEHMTSLYEQGRCLMQAGKPVAARRALETIIGQFSAMRGSEPFERTRRLLADLDRRR